MKGSVTLTELLEKLVDNYRQSASESISQHDGRVFFPREVVRREQTGRLDESRALESVVLSNRARACYPTLELANQGTNTDGAEHEGYFVIDAYSGEALDCIDREGNSTIEHLQTTGIETFRSICRDIRGYANMLAGPDGFYARKMAVITDIIEDAKKANAGLSLHDDIMEFAKSKGKFLDSISIQDLPLDIIEEAFAHVEELRSYLDKQLALMERVAEATHNVIPVLSSAMASGDMTDVNTCHFMDDIARAEWTLERVRRTLKKGYERLAYAYQRIGREEESAEAAEKAKEFVEAGK